MAPAANASRMNSVSNMDVRGVVPGRRERARAAVEDDRAADEHEPVDERSTAPNSCETSRIVTPRSRCSSPSSVRQRLLGVDVDARRRLVQDEQLRCRSERLRHEGPLLLAAGEPRDHAPALRREADPGDRLVDARAVLGGRPRQDAPPGDEACRDELVHGHRRLDAEPRALRQVADPRAPCRVRRGLAEQERGARGSGARARAPRGGASSCRRRSGRRWRRTRPPRRRGRRRGAPAARRGRRTRRRGARRLAAPERLSQLAEVGPHRGEVVAGASAVPRAGRARQCAFRSRARPCRRCASRRAAR